MCRFMLQCLYLLFCIYIVGIILMLQLYVVALSKWYFHPLAKPAIQNGTATDEKSEIDGNFFTAQDENTIWTMMPQVIKALK